jgi:hypothetical protein
MGATDKGPDDGSTDVVAVAIIVPGGCVALVVGTVVDVSTSVMCC